MTPEQHEHFQETRDFNREIAMDQAAHHAEQTRLQQELWEILDKCAPVLTAEEMAMLKWGLGL